MTALIAVIAVVNLVLLALVGADRVDKSIFFRFMMFTMIGGLLASKLGILRDYHVFTILVIALSILDLVLVVIYQIVLELRRRRRSQDPKGNILTRLQRIYSLNERRRLPDWERPELADITRELEKQGFHALGDFEEVALGQTFGPARAFLNEDRTTTAYAFVRQDARKKIQPTAVSFLTELSGDRWVLTDPTPSRHSFATLDRPPNVHRSGTATGWSAATAAKAHAVHVAECIAEYGAAPMATENTFEAWCARRDAYWTEVCAYRKKLGFLTEAESLTMFGNDNAYREVVRLLAAGKPKSD